VNGRTDCGTISLKTKIKSEEMVTVFTGYQSISKERSAGSFSRPNLQILKDRSGSMTFYKD